MNRTDPDAKRIEGMDFIRALATFGVFFYHCAGSSKCAKIQALTRCANGAWGPVWVCLFFMLSGALLYHRSAGDVSSSPLEFYRRRLRAIYPPFWIAYALHFAKNALEAGSFFYKGNPPLLILSVLGLDGYFKYRLPTYYLVGEWFLGAILLLYLLCPLLLRAFRRAPCLLCGALLAAFLAVENTDFFTISVERNLITCALEFTLGMLLMKHRERLRTLPLPGLIGLLLAEVLLLVLPLPLRAQSLAILHAALLYVLLGSLGAWLARRSRAADAAVRSCAGLSYCVYLTHRTAIRAVQSRWNPAGSLAGLAALLLCALATAALAAALRLATRWILGLPSRFRAARGAH